MKTFSLVILAIVCVSPAFADGSRKPAQTTGSLTPPPKEWAMFQDEPSAQAPQQAATQTPQAGQTAPSRGAPSTAPSAENSGNFVSAPRVQAAPQHDLPLLWLTITGVLSLGAVLASGSLILRKEDTAEQSAGVPVVSDNLEVKA